MQNEEVPVPHVMLTGKDYAELVEKVRKYEQCRIKVSEHVNAILAKLKREYGSYIEQREELREISIGIKIFNQAIVDNFQTQLLVEHIKRFEELLK